MPIGEPIPQLFGFPPSTFSQTAALALIEKNVQFSWVRPDLDDARYRRLHPFAKVPVLTHGGITISETLAIAVYVDETFGGPALLPTGMARYDTLTWISVYNDYFVNSILEHGVRERFVKPMFGLRPDEGKIRDALPLMDRCVETLDAELARNAFIVGDGLTLADLFYIPTMLYFAATPEGRKLLDGRHNLARWLRTMAGRPAVKATCVQMHD